MTAYKLEGRAGRFDFINGCYEPMQITHNDRPCFVSRAVAPRYLFHTGQNRWVLSKVLDDGYRCWGFISCSSDSKSPLEVKGQWTFCDEDNQWRADPNIVLQPVAASNDSFVQLRMTLDNEMRQYGLIERASLKKLWRRLDYNGNNIVSLAEIDKCVVEMVAAGIWPSWLNNKPALMRAYKKTILKDGDGDDWVEKHEFHALLLNIFWFNKLWQIFDHIDTGDDRRIDINEFMAGMSKLGLNMSPQEAQAEFKKMDENGGGQVLFVELCGWVRNRVNPDAQAQFDADIVSGSHCGKASYNKVKTRDLAPSAAVVTTRDLPMGGGGGYTSPTDTLRASGGANKATQNHLFKNKTFRDFDELETKLRDKAKDKAGLKAMWRLLDYNGNGIVSLAEIDKWAVERYPLLNHKPALMRCYKCTIKQGSYGDDWVHRKDFKRMIINMFYFNKLFWIFDQVDGDDRRITLPEFKECLCLCGSNLSDAEARKEFMECDKNGGGIILFDEFCHWFCSKNCPEELTDFVDDEQDRTGKDGTEDVLKHAGKAKYHAIGNGKVALNKPGQYAGFMSNTPGKYH